MTNAFFLLGGAVLEIYKAFSQIISYLMEEKSLLYESAVLVIGIHIQVMPLASVNFLYPLSSNTNYSPCKWMDTNRRVKEQNEIVFNT